MTAVATGATGLQDAQPIRTSLWSDTETIIAKVKQASMEHTHMWIVDSPDGTEQSSARCSCGEIKTFFNSVEAAIESSDELDKAHAWSTQNKLGFNARGKNKDDKLDQVDSAEREVERKQILEDVAHNERELNNFSFKRSR